MARHLTGIFPKLRSLTFGVAVIFSALCPALAPAAAGPLTWGKAQHEVQAAASTDGRDILVAWSDSTGKGLSSWNCAFSASNDGGTTWQETQSEKSSEYKISANPTVAVTDDGRMYVVCMLVSSLYDRGELVLRSSADHGKSWTPWRSVLKVNGGIPDRPKIAANKDGSVYLIFTEIRPTPAGEHDEKCWVDMRTSIQLLVSRDGGESWASPRNLSVDRNGCHPIEGDQGGAVRVAGNGDLLLSWAGYHTGNIYFTRSHDQGKSFSPLKELKVNNEEFSDPPCTEIAEANRHLALTVHLGHALGNAYYAVSKDHGRSWSTPARISRNGTNVSPAIDAQGRLHLLWTEANSTSLFTKYSVFSGDFGNRSRSGVSAQSPLPTGFTRRGNGELGSYQSLLAMPEKKVGAFYFDWPDGRPALKTSWWEE